MTIRVRGGEDVKSMLVTRPFYVELVELVELLKASAPADPGEIVTPAFEQLLALPDIRRTTSFIRNGTDVERTPCRRPLNSGAA